MAYGAQETQRVTCFSISGLVIAIIGVCMGGVAFDEIKTLRNYQVVTRDVLDANTKQDALTTQTLTDKINSLEAAIIANTQRDDSTAQTLTNKINKLEDTLRDAIAANTQQDGVDHAAHSKEILINQADIDTNVKAHSANAKAHSVNAKAHSVNAEDIDTNKDAIESNAEDIDTNKDAIADNAEDIDTNKGEIESNAEDIATNKDAIDVNADAIDTNKGAIADNADAIDTTKDAIADNPLLTNFTDLQSQVLSNNAHQKTMGWLAKVVSENVANGTLGTPSPTKSPTKAPTLSPTKAPTKAPTLSPTKAPTKAPTADLYTCSNKACVPTDDVNGLTYAKCSGNCN
jgi:hypothetical protein